MKEVEVRTTVTVDDELMARAQALTGTTERSALIRQALEALVARESAHRLARLGGTDPAAEAAPRSRQAREPRAGRPRAGASSASEGASRRRPRAS